MKIRQTCITLFVVALLSASCWGGDNPYSTDTLPHGKQKSIESSVGGQDSDTEAQINLAGPPPESGDTLRWVDGSLLVYIPPGDFVMGHGGEDNPEHVVYLDGFWIYRTEVTNRMYRRCVAMGECMSPTANPNLPDFSDPDFGDNPIVNINWSQAENYCHFIGGFLPTESQWEKTARGMDARIYPWGNAEPNCELLNFNECLGEASPVLEFPGGASPYDVLDMAGNVYEWVSDWYQPEYYYPEEHSDNPMGPDVGEVKSVRGSAFNTFPGQVSSALRFYLDPISVRPDLGFRCVVTNAEKYAPPCEVIAHVSLDVQGDPGEPPGGSASCVVQEPVLSVVTYCERGVRGNNISWTPADADLNYSSSSGVSCSQFDADTLACAGRAGGTVDVNVCKSCPPPVVELGVLASCDLPYALDESAGICRYTGLPVPGRDLCTPQFSLLALPETVCCVMDDGTPHDFPVCPPGGRYDSLSRICWFTLPSTGDQKCASQTVHFDSCRRSGSEGNGRASCSSFGSQSACVANGCQWGCVQFGNQQVCNCYP